MADDHRTPKAISPVSIKEVGEVREVKKSIVRIGGLESCLNGQAIEFASGVKGMVMGFDPQGVLGLLLGYEAKVRSGEKVVSQFEPFRIPTGTGFLGRVVDVFGNPCDKKGSIIPDSFQSVFRNAPETMERGVTDQPLETGIG